MLFTMNFLFILLHITVKLTYKFSLTSRYIDIIKKIFTKIINYLTPRIKLLIKFLLQNSHLTTTYTLMILFDGLIFLKLVKRLL